MDVKYPYRFRFYPTDEQESILSRTFGCVRFIYNELLKIRTEAWKVQKRINYLESSSILTKLKQASEYSWLNEVSSVPVQQGLRHLQTAFVNFWAKRTRYPAFKTRWDKQSAEYTASAFTWNPKAKQLKLAKMVEPLNIRWSRTLSKASKLTTVTVSRDSAGRYFVSLLCDDAVSAKPTVAGQIGIDLGLKHFAVLSSGEKISSPRIFRRYEDRLAILQKRLSKKLKGSFNRAKARLKVARLHARIADARKDFLHKLSTRLIDENQVIAVESLAVSNMQKNRKLSKSIMDASWSEFIRQLRYKALWYGRTLIGIDRWYPSSKRCNDCGYILSKMSLDIREWNCPECGVVHDRDVNAARNVLTAGLAGLVCGENVKPDSVSLGSGRSRRNRKFLDASSGISIL
jgi:putative transposase